MSSNPEDETVSARPSISVVMGTYNGARYLQTQICSILEQTVLPDEIVVGDDGSSDGSLKLLAEIAQNSRVPIRVTSNPVTLGFAENFLTTAQRASGEYIAFSDQDDVWQPHKLARGLQALHEHRAVLCAHAVSQIDENGKQIRLVEAEGPRIITPAVAEPWGNFYGFTMLFPRSLLEKIDSSLRGDDPHTPGARLSHDRWIYFLASISGDMVYLREDLAAYRQHSGQLYGGTKARSIIERIQDKVVQGEELTLNLAQISQGRAELLTTFNDDLSRAAESRWRAWNRALLVSAELYGSAPLGHRVRTFVRALAGGVYRPTSSGGLGTRRLRHDLVMVGVPR